MLLYIILDIMLAYIMLFAALSSAVCLHNAHGLFISCIILHHAVLLICWFILILCSHRFVVVDRAMCSLEK